MSFFSQLKDEMHDKNIDKTKLHDLTADLPEQQVQGPDVQPAQPKQPDVDPDFPDHPDYIALKPRLTEVTLWNMPALRFYLTLIFFCAGMIAYGIINQVFDLGMTKGAVGWWQIIGAAAGFLFSREYAEPHLRIPFSKGTYEQKKKAVDAYLAEMTSTSKTCRRCRASQRSRSRRHWKPFRWIKNNKKRFRPPFGRNLFLWSED